MKKQKTNKKLPLSKHLFTALLVLTAAWLVCSQKPGWCHDIGMMSLILAVIALIDLTGTYFFAKRNRNNRDNGTLKTILTVLLCAIIIFLLSLYYGQQIISGLTVL